MLAVVEDQQRVPLDQLSAEAFEGRSLGREGEPERGGGRGRHQRGVAEARQLHEPDAVAAHALTRAVAASRPRRVLPDPPGARERDQAIAVEQPGDLAQLAVAPDEARQRDRQVMTSGLGGRAPRRARRLLAQLRLGRVGVDLAAQQRPIQACGLRVGLRLELAPKRLRAAGGIAPSACWRRPSAANIRISARCAASCRGSTTTTCSSASIAAALSPPSARRAESSSSSPRCASRTASRRPADPRFVAILGEQLAAVKRERRPIVRRLAGLAGAGDGRLEDVDVDLHLARPDTAPACRRATGARPKRRRRPPPAPAGRHTAPDGSCWPPPRATAQATTARSPAPGGLDAQARARAASPGSWPYASRHAPSGTTSSPTRTEKAPNSRISTALSILHPGTTSNPAAPGRR